MASIKSMHVDNYACVRVKGGESEQFRIDSGMREVYHVPWLFNVYMDGVMEVKMGMYANDLVPCGEKEEDLRVTAGWFAEVCRRRGLNINAGKSKVMVLNGKEGLE